MVTFSDILVTKTSKNEQHIFVCNLCDYKCSKKGNMDRHLNSLKHQKVTFSNKKRAENEQNEQKPYMQSENKYCCEFCEKSYESRNGLWRHKKTCNKEKNTELNDKELIMLLIKENSELKNIMMEQQNMVLKVLENGTTNNSNNTTNSHNKAFNLNFFLIETCKDAMNITDFVNSIELQLGDLERVGEVGYVESISNIIVKNLKELDVTQRPVHCTDKKRETMYVKDENTWEKDEEKKKMHKLVKKVADKNMRLLPAYREKHPDYIKASSLSSDKYNQMFLESFGGSGDNNFEKEEKIIQRVSREVFVDKNL
jgi:hypothetical protein